MGVKIKVTGEETYKWLATKFWNENGKKHCLAQKTFTAACFQGKEVNKDKYKVHLKASEEEQKEEKEEEEKNEEKEEKDEKDEKEENQEKDEREEKEEKEE